MSKQQIRRLLPLDQAPPVKEKKTPFPMDLGLSLSMNTNYDVERITQDIAFTKGSFHVRCSNLLKVLVWTDPNLASLVIFYVFQYKWHGLS